MRVGRTVINYSNDVSKPNAGERDNQLGELVHVAIKSVAIGLATYICMDAFSITPHMASKTAEIAFLASFAFFASKISRQKRPAIPRRTPLIGKQVYCLQTPTVKRQVSLSADVCANLEQGNKLDSKVLEAFFLLLQHEKKREETFPVQVVFKELFPGQSPHLALFSECDLAHAEIILIPRFVLNNSHFTLYVVDIKNAKISYFDPSGDVDPEAGTFLKSIKNALGEYNIDKEYSIETSTRGGTLVSIQQEGEAYCGFYVCAYALYILGQSLPRTSLKIADSVRCYLSEQTGKSDETFN